MNDYNEALAHYGEDNQKQLLIDHLFKVGNRARDLGCEVKLGNSSQLIGLLHDFGKVDKKFQAYIRGAYKGRVNHSSAGAIIIEHISEEVYNVYHIKGVLESKNLKINVWNLYKEILQYPILSHHGLYDIIDNNFNYRTASRLDLQERTNEESIVRNLEFFNMINQSHINLYNNSIYNLYYKGFQEFIKIYKSIIKLSKNTILKSNQNYKIHRMKSRHFYFGALVRLLLSILKEADIYDSSNYYKTEKDKTYSQKELDSIWEGMGQTFTELYEEFSKKSEKSELDIIRTEFSNEAYDFSHKFDKGAFKLDLPVGSGKTFTSFRYGIENARKFHKKRIICCTAFLSVLEQNASTITEVLGSQYILEHHSNIIEDYEVDEEEQDKKDYEVSEYLKESWESPVLLTTLVQLSNTMFKHKASNIRRFSKLINSVIIVDEIQSLPTKAIYNFNLMTNFLTEIMNCTVVHSTATSPSFDNNETLNYPCNYGNELGETSIIKTIKNKEVFSRVDYYSLLDKETNNKFNRQDLISHIKNQLKTEKSALIVLNTKRAVDNLYQALNEDTVLKEDNIEIIYLTTNQCAKHRLEIIENMKNRLKDLRKYENERKIICISTKLVEAGVDIDFDIAYRSLAGIDSIIQVGGRCNREGKKESKGNLFIFKYEDENLKDLPEIQRQISASETALKILNNDTELDKIDIEKACDYYFHKLYLNEEGRGNNLEYVLKKQDNTILNLLSSNAKLKENYEQKTGEKANFTLKQSFKTAAMEFDLIKEDTITVIVHYKNEKIINSLYESINSYDFYNIKTLLKKLQPYTISVRNIGKYENYITKELDGEILILNQEAYDYKVGLTKGELQTLYF